MYKFLLVVVVLSWLTICAGQGTRLIPDIEVLPHDDGTSGVLRFLNPSDVTKYIDLYAPAAGELTLRADTSVDTNLDIDAQPSQLGKITFQQEGVDKWIIRKIPANDLVFYNSTLAATSMSLYNTGQIAVKDVVPFTAAGSDIGSTSLPMDQIFASHIHMVDTDYDSSWFFQVANDAGTLWELRNAGGAQALTFDQSIPRFTIYATLTHAGGGGDIGLFGQAFTNLYINTVDVSNNGSILMGANSTFDTITQGGGVGVHGDWIPDTDNLYDLGSVSGTWELLHVGMITVGSAFGDNWIEFVEQTPDPGCAANEYAIWANSLDQKLKMCENGSIVELGGGASLPVTDTTSVVEGSADDTKEIRFEVDGLTTGTVRVLTPPDADIVMAGVDYANSWSATQGPSAAASYDLGALATPWRDIFGRHIRMVDTDFNSSWLMEVNNAAGTIWTLRDAGSTPRINIDQSTHLMQMGGNVTPMGSAVSIGLVGSPWNTGYFNNLNIAASGTITIGSNTRTTGDFLPTTDNTYDLGSNTYKWAELQAVDGFFTDDLAVTDDVDVDGLVDVAGWVDGAGGFRVNGSEVISSTRDSSFVDGVFTDDVIISDDLTVNGGITTHFSPVSDNTINLGGALARYATVYSYDGNFKDDVTVSDNLTVTTSVIPNSDTSGTVGSVARTWNSIYGATFYGGTTSQAGVTITIACGAGQSVTGMTITGGIVTANPTCSTP